MSANRIWRSDKGRVHPERVTARQRKILDVWMRYESYDMCAYTLGLSKKNVTHSLERTRAHLKAGTNKEAYGILRGERMAMAS